MIYIKLLLTSVFWGGTFVAARIVTQHVPPFSASFLRFLVASIILVPLAIKIEGRIRPLKKHHVIPAILLGLTGVFAYNVFFFLGLKAVTASRASLIIASNPVFISLFSAYFFKEKLHALNGLGMFCCFAGALLVISQGDPTEIFTGGVGWGELCIMGCVASWVAYSLIGKAVMRDISPLTAVTTSCIIGAASLLPPALCEGMAFQMGGYFFVDWLGILYLGILGTVIGFLWYYEGIKMIGASRAAVFINFVPVAGVFLGWLILGETLNLSVLLGAALVIGGVFLVTRPKTP